MKRIHLAALLIVIVAAFNLELSGQGTNVFLANKAYDNLQYTTAASFYNKALYKFKGSKRQQNELIFRLGECYRMINNPVKAGNSFQRLVNNKYADEKPLVFLYYGKALLDQAKYKDALPMFDKYLAKVPDDLMGQAGKASSELGLKTKSPNKSWVVRNIREINSDDDDFAAVLLGSKSDSVLFSSNRRGTTGNKTDTWTDGYLSDLLIAVKSTKDVWGKPKSADNNGQVNTESNEGAAILLKNGGKLYFTRCPQEEKGKDFCQILEAEKKGNDWGKVRVIYSDNQGNAGQPAFTSDGLTMLFVSGRAGGFGGKDLWKTTRDSVGKVFGSPENMGPGINTAGDEMFPGYFSDTVLYFASNGRVGFGGLDIYRASLQENTPTVIRHLPQPVNSSSDDFAISFQGDGKKGLFTSRRTGGRGGDDIYSFERAMWKASLQGTVTNENTQKPIGRQVVLMVNALNDTTRSITNGAGIYTYENGQVKMGNTYTMIFTADNYFIKKSDVYIREAGQDTTYTLNAALSPIPEKPVVLPDIYYEYDKSDLLPQYRDSLMILVNLLKDNPEIKIELASHTDSRASDAYNDELSQKRAESVVSFLIDKGISRNRLAARGYGKRIPRVLSADIVREGFTFERGLKLSEEYVLSLTDPKKREAAYQLNRRTEFTVTGKNAK